MSGAAVHNDWMSEPRIRRAQPGDAGSLGRLGALLVQEHYEFDQARFLAPTTDTPQMYGSFLASQLEEPEAVILVAEHEGRVIGYAYGAIEGHDYMALRGPAAVLHDLIVDPEHRRRGVGEALLNAVLSALANDQAPRVVLSTAHRNATAQRFFERMGFRRTMVEMTRELA
jgi:ribosomal protein S18 acetylase RimI-like enzyme